MTVHGFCEADEFRCANGSCIARNKVRDGVVDCYGGRFDESKQDKGKSANHLIALGIMLRS